MGFDPAYPGFTISPESVEFPTANGVGGVLEWASRQAWSRRAAGEDVEAVAPSEAVSLELPQDAYAAFSDEVHAQFGFRLAFSNEPDGSVSWVVLAEEGLELASGVADTVSAALPRNQSSSSAIATNFNRPRLTQRSSGAMCSSKKSRLQPSACAASLGFSARRNELALEVRENSQCADTAAPSGFAPTGLHVIETAILDLMSPCSVGRVPTPLETLQKVVVDLELDDRCRGWR